MSQLRAIEQRVKEQFELRDAELVVVDPNLGPEFTATLPSGGELFPILRRGDGTRRLPSSRTGPCFPEKRTRRWNFCASSCRVR